MSIAVVACKPQYLAHTSSGIANMATRRHLKHTRVNSQDFGLGYNDEKGPRVVFRLRQKAFPVGHVTVWQQSCHRPSQQGRVARDQHRPSDEYRLALFFQKDAKTVHQVHYTCSVVAQPKRQPNWVCPPSITNYSKIYRSIF